jgi:hypothetical protein
MVKSTAVKSATAEGLAYIKPKCKKQDARRERRLLWSALSQLMDLGLLLILIGNLFSLQP